MRCFVIEMLWRVDIIDSKTGICLFERIWKWSGPCNPETSASICNLILTFYMFSKELDSGEVSVAEFSPELLSSRPGGRGAARGSSAVRMSCRRNDPLIVAAFHNVRDDVEAIGDFLAKAEEEFIERHGEQHASMRGQLDSMVDEHLESQCTQMDVFKNFEEFDGNVKKLQKTYFPNQGAPEKKEDIVSDDTLTETEDSDSRAERKAKKAAAGKSKLASASTDAPRETKNEPAEDQDD